MKRCFRYEYVDDCEKFYKTSLPEKEEFDSNLKMEDITDANYAHTKTICKDFEIKNLGKYHDLYVQSNTLVVTYGALWDNFQF